MTIGSTEDDDASIVRLLWSPKPPPRFGPQPSLTRAALAAAAVEVADAEGLQAVSMQRVASSLGVTKNALYRYVRSKAELVALTVEHAVDDPPDLSHISPWRPRVEQWAEDLHTVWRRHPWIPAATTGNRPMGPREVGWVEAALAALSRSRLPVPERLDVVLALFALMRTVALTGTQPWTLPGDGSKILLARMRDHPELYPALLDASDTFTADVQPASTSTPDTVGPATGTGWRVGLRLLLDGIEARQR